MTKAYFILNNTEYFLKDIYMEYEQPELFTVCDAIGTLYLVMLTNEINERWLMVPISAKKLLKLEYGKISIREAFVNAEMQFVSLIQIVDGQLKQERISPENIKEDDLPLEDAHLNWNNNPIPNIQEELLETAQNRQKDILDIRVDSFVTEDHTIDTKMFGSLLLTINDAIMNVAKNRKQGQRMPKGYLASCSTHYIGSYSGSFGIRLEGLECVNMFDETPLTPILKDLFVLLKKHNENELLEVVKANSFEYTKALRKLLKYSSDNQVNLDFSYTTPKATEQGRVVWEKEYAYKTLNFLDGLIRNEVKEEVYKGTLVSVSKQKNNFTLITEAQEEIKGTIDESLKNQVFKVESKVKITVSKTIKINHANETEEKYRLINFEEL